MGDQTPAGKEMFPGDKAEDKDYDLIATLSSIPSIGKAWAYPADDPEFKELSVRIPLLPTSSKAKGYEVHA